MPNTMGCTRRVTFYVSAEDRAPFYSTLRCRAQGVLEILGEDVDPAEIRGVLPATVLVERIERARALPVEDGQVGGRFWHLGIRESFFERAAGSLECLALAAIETGYGQIRWA